MKKYIPIVFAAFALLVVFMPRGQAKAFSLSVVPTYFQANSLFVDHLGDIQVDWQKIQLGFGGYNLPSGDGLMVMVGATTTLPTLDVGIDFENDFSPCSNNQTPGFLDNVLLSYYVGSNCSGDTFSHANTNTYGNNGNGDTVWNGATGAFVNANSITLTTPVYVVLVSGLSQTYTGCGTYGCTNIALVSTSTQYVDSETLYPNFVTASLGAVISSPPNGSVGTDFNSWSVTMTNTATSTATGTIQITYALASATSTIIGVDSSTDWSLPGGGSFTQDIEKTVPLWYPQATGTIQYVAYLNLITAAETYPTSSITFGINGAVGQGTCDTPAGVNLTTPRASSTIQNDFSNWVISTPQLQEGCTYVLKVGYYPDNETAGITGVTDQQTVSVTPTYNPSAVSVVKSKNLWNYYNGSTTQIDFGVQLINQQDGIIIGSQLGSFNIGYSATSTTNAPPGFTPSEPCGGVCQGYGTVGGGNIVTTTSTIASAGAACVAPDDGAFSFFTGADLLYAGCETLNWLFVPNSATQGIISSDMNTLETVPPFSWFFQTNAEIAAVANGDTSYVTPGGSAVYTINPNTSTTPNNGLSFQQPLFGGGTTTVNLMPANLTTNTFLVDGVFVDDWYNFVLTFFIFLFIIMMYKLIL